MKKDCFLLEIKAVFVLTPSACFCTEALLNRQLNRVSVPRPKCDYLLPEPVRKLVFLRGSFHPVCFNFAPHLALSHDCNNSFSLN